jgi:hypothetical protein
LNFDPVSERPAKRDYHLKELLEMRLHLERRLFVDPRDQMNVCHALLRSVQIPPEA